MVCNCSWLRRVHTHRKPGINALTVGYSPYTVNQGGYANSFQSFGLDIAQPLPANSTFNATLNSENLTVFGGTPLSRGAAYLYAQFATGFLDYNYSNNPNPNRSLGANGAANLQLAILYFMGEYGTEGSYPGSSNPFVNQVDGTFGQATAFSPDNGADDVSVLNLWGPGQPEEPDNAYENVLIYTGPSTPPNPPTVPEQTSTLALSALSIASTLAFRACLKKRLYCHG